MEHDSAKRYAAQHAMDPLSGSPRDQNHVQSVQRALDVLSVFDAQNPEWGVTDLSRRLDLPKSIIARLVATLERNGYVSQNPSSKKYRLGLSIFRLAAAYASQNDLIRIGDRVLRELVAKTQYTAQIGILDGVDHISLVVVPSPKRLAAHLRPGERLPAHFTATGRVLLAQLGEDRLRTLYPDEQLNPTPHGRITGFGALISELRQVRQQGYAMGHGDFEGMGAVAAPICDYQGRVVAGLSLAWPAQFASDEQVNELVRQVILAANEVSRLTGSYSALY